MKAHALIVVGVLAVGSGCWTMPSSSNSQDNKYVSGTYSPSPTASATPTPTASPAANSNMTSKPADNKFTSSLASDFVQPADDALRLLLREYGAVYVARGGTTVSKKVAFKDEADVRSFQSSFQSASEAIGGFKVELQAPALKALKEAIAEAKSAGVAITPRGADSARRGYEETVKLWASRVNPGLDHWVGRGRVTQADAARIKALSPYDQVPEILKLEKQGIFFAKDLSKSIIYSVAPPGTSQHLSMLALDVTQNDNAKVREILAKHGWYQTVVSDMPHFTYLGLPESELPSLGLKKTTSAGRTFWVPDI